MITKDDDEGRRRTTRDDDDDNDDSKVEYVTTGEDEKVEVISMGRVCSYLRRSFHAVPCILENLELSLGESLLGGAVGRRHDEL